MASKAEDLAELHDDSFVDEPSDDSEGAPSVEATKGEEDKVARLLRQLQSSGALITKPHPVQQVPLCCLTCDLVFADRESQNVHLLRHVSMPSLVLTRVPSYAEDSDDDSWSDDDLPTTPIKTINTSIAASTTPLSIGKFLGSNISIKKATPEKTPSAISKTMLGNILIKKLPYEQEVRDEDDEDMDDAVAVMQKIAAPPLRMTIKHTYGKDDFQVVTNGANDIKSETVPVSAAPNVGAARIKRTSISRISVGEPELDIKDGILEDFIRTTIKKDPDAVSGSSAHTTQAIAKVKDEVRSRPQTPETGQNQSGNNLRDLQAKRLAEEQAALIPKPMIIPKKEPEPACMVIEINGDDSDGDDVMFVPLDPKTMEDRKPILPLQQIDRKPVITEISANDPMMRNVSVITGTPVPTSLMMGMPTQPVTSRLSASSAHSNMTNLNVSTSKQHSFDWNAPSKGFDSRQQDSLEAMRNMTKTHDNLDSSIQDKNVDAIFESLLASHGKDGHSDIGASEYISLDKLGPQHTCEVCKTRFTDLSLLEQHKRTSGHSNQLVTPSSSSGAVLPSYSSGGFLNLFPKQIVETVGKLTGSGAPFTHQQNIMVNIQSFPGQGFMPGQQQPQPDPPYPGNYPPGFRPPPYQGYPPAQQPYNPPGYPQYNQNQPQYGQQAPGQPQHGQPYGYPNNGAQQPNMFSGGGIQQPMPGFPAANQANQGQMAPGGAQLPGPQLGAMYGQAAQAGYSPSNRPGYSSSPSQDLSSQSPKPAPQGIRIQNAQNTIGQKPAGPRLALNLGATTRGRGRGGMRGRGGIRPPIRPGLQVQGGGRGGMRLPLKRPAGLQQGPSPKKRLDGLIPDRHDSEDCQVVAMQRQREGLPHIQSIQGSREKELPPAVNLSSQITVTKTRVKAPTPPPSTTDAGAVANLLAMRGIKITPKARSPSPPPLPNLGSAISVSHTKVPSSRDFVLPEDKTHDVSCNLCSKNFANSAALSVHIGQMHPSQKLRCDSCPVSYQTSSQLQEHKRVFHNTNSEVGLPVIDLSNQASIRKLHGLGIFNFIPLANREQGGGCFGIPIVSISNALNGNINHSLQALGANGLLSLGPVKPLPKC